MSVWSKINKFSEGFARGYVPASQNKYAYQARQGSEDRADERVRLDAAEKIFATGNYTALEEQYPDLWESQFKARVEGTQAQATTSAFEGIGSAVSKAKDVQATATGPQDQPRIQSALEGVRGAEQDLVSRVRDPNSNIKTDEDWEKVYSGLREASAAAGPPMAQATGQGTLKPGLVATSQRLQQQKVQTENRGTILAIRLFRISLKRL